MYDRKSFLKCLEDMARALSRFGPEKNSAYVCGGKAAMYHGMSYRFSLDLDVFFDVTIGFPEIVGEYRTDQGKVAVRMDRNFNSFFIPLHADFEERAVPFLETENMQFFILGVPDLIITKLARFSENDRQDVVALMEIEPIAPERLRMLTEEALQYYVGNPERVRYHLDQVYH